MLNANFMLSPYAAQVSHEDRRSDREDDGQHEDRSRRQTDLGPREGAFQLGALRRGKHDGVHPLVRSAYSRPPRQRDCFKSRLSDFRTNRSAARGAMGPAWGNST